MSYGRYTMTMALVALASFALCKSCQPPRHKDPELVNYMILHFEPQDMMQVNGRFLCQFTNLHGEYCRLYLGLTNNLFMNKYPAPGDVESIPLREVRP